MTDIEDDGSFCIYNKKDLQENFDKGCAAEAAAWRAALSHANAQANIGHAVNLCLTHGPDKALAMLISTPAEQAPVAKKDERAAFAEIVSPEEIYKRINAK